MEEKEQGVWQDAETDFETETPKKVETLEDAETLENVERLETAEEEPALNRETESILARKKIRTAWERGERAVGAFFKRIQYPLLLAFITLTAFVLRTYLFEAETRDYQVFLLKWFQHIQENGGFLALGQPIPGADYSPAYYYIFAILTYIPVKPVYSIKVVSCLFDIFLAVSIMLCAWAMTKDKKVAVIAYAVGSFLPTVFLNSAAWGQCDVIYASFAVFSLYFLLKKHYFTAAVIYGIAFSFKLQAIFMAPLFAVLWFKRKIPRTTPLIILGVYFLTCVPMWLMGRDLGDLLLVYLKQTGQYNNSLSLNAPSFLALLGNLSQGWVEKLSPTFVIFTFSVTGIVMYIAGHTDLDKKENLVGFALLFSLFIPYFLPHMHERYFYLADVLSIVYVVLNRKRWYTAVLTQVCSLYAVSKYLFAPTWLSLAEIAIVQGLNILLLCKDLWKDHAARQLPVSWADKEV